MNTIASVDVQAGSVTFQYATPIPFELRDDDQAFTPALPPLDATIDAFSEAYIKVLADGGGAASFESSDVPLKLNISEDDTDLKNYVRPHVQSNALRS